jgi:serine/threonine protein kinase
MALTIGSRLGPYEILSAIGAGGMGEVYRARDTKLNRNVALKILPDAFADDPDRLARFTREAQTLAALNHPNIAHVHGLEESGGVRALVMELVEGEDLAQRLVRGPIPLDEALPIAKQIAEALEAAHEQGIIHRDLKPANIKVRDDGAVKVLDFGLAKALAGEAAGTGPGAAALTNSPTLTSPAMMTGVGVLLGTAAYMAPEQAKGRTADKRSDIWAFGCVLYEMLTGNRAFEGEDVSDTLATVLKSDPNWAALPIATPPLIRRLLQRCLAKDRNARIPDIAVARFAIEEVLSGAVRSGVEPSATGTSARPSRVRRWLPIAATAVIAGVLVGVPTWVWLRPSPQPVLRLSAMPTDGSPVGDSSPASDVAITPDGRRIVYAVGQSPATGQLFVRSLDQLEATRLKGLTGVYAPFLSPDGEWVGYFDAGTMKKVAITGGPPVTICAIDGPATGSPPRSASWGSDGTIVFSAVGGPPGGSGTTFGLLRVADGGGKPEILATPDLSKGEFAYILPDILPGGHAVLFAIVSKAQQITADDTRIAVRDLRIGQTKVLIQGGSTPRYAASGHLVYAAAGSLRAVPFDLDRLDGGDLRCRWWIMSRQRERWASPAWPSPEMARWCTGLVTCGLLPVHPRRWSGWTGWDMRSRSAYRRGRIRTRGCRQTARSSRSTFAISRGTTSGSGTSRATVR